MRRVVFIALLATLLPAIAVQAESNADEQMARRVGSVLKDSGQLQNYHIGVKFHDGTAFLEGTVTSVEQRTKAVQLAKHIKGVSRVQYKLEIPNKEDVPAEPKATGENDRAELSAALDQASYESRPQQREGVMQSYQQ